jgi:uncharacterized protein (TIGR03085 family)
MVPDTAPFSQRERWALCDLLSELGPGAPTLCEGWHSADLAAHLVARDRRPDAVPGMVVSFAPLRNWADRVQHGLRDTTPWPDLVARARSGPAAFLRPFDQDLNTIEYFVHHEDLRRAQPGWEPRSLAPADEAVLWRHLRWMRPLLRSKAALVEAPGFPPLKFPRAAPGTLAEGPVPELVLWLLGRTAAARVPTCPGP